MAYPLKHPNTNISRIVEHKTLTSEDLTNNYIEVSHNIDGNLIITRFSDSLILLPKTVYDINRSVTYTGQTIHLSGMGYDSELEVNDILIIDYEYVSE